MRLKMMKNLQFKKGFNMKKHIRQRQDFIKKTINKKGSINRKDIVEEFEVSYITAANDIKYFKLMNPNFIEYCFKQKTYKKVFTSV